MKKYKPTSPGRRAGEVIDYRGLVEKKAPEKGLTFGFHRSVGRNNRGRITTRHKGAGVKRLYRMVDFMYDKKNVFGTVEAVEYDPNRTAFIALIQFKDGERRYVLASQGMKKGSRFLVSESAPIEDGSRTLLKNIPVGTFVYAIELAKNRGAKLARSAGSSAQVLAIDAGYTTLKMPSSEIRKVRSDHWASIGVLSNPERSFMTIGKAGRNRHRGIRPSVRGTAMNPRDHKHGGGEGRTQLGFAMPRTPWGKPARGVKTRSKKKRTNVYIIQRRIKKRRTK